MRVGKKLIWTCINCKITAQHRPKTERQKGSKNTHRPTFDTSWTISFHEKQPFKFTDFLKIIPANPFKKMPCIPIF